MTAGGDDRAPKEPLRLPADLYELEAQMRDAVTLEDYSSAAQIRDRLRAAREEDAVARELAALRAAIEQEDFDQAAAQRAAVAGAVMARARAPRAGGAVTDRLLVVDAKGRMLTCNPEGNAQFVLGSDAGADAQYVQPTWSPGGDLVCATLLTGDAREKSSSTVRVLWAIDGSLCTEIEAPFVPFYFYWSPDSGKLSYLTSYKERGAQAVSLDTFQVFEDSGAADARSAVFRTKLRHVEEGVPLFFSQNAEDARMLVHVGDKKKVSVLQPASLDASEEESVCTRPGNFRTPLWVPNSGGLVVFVEVASNGQTQNLVLADPEAPGAPRRRALCECAGFTAVSVSPDGSRIAVLTRDKKQLTEQLVLLEGPFEIDDDWPTPPDVVETSPPKENLFEGSRRAIAFYWSPDSSKLLWLSVPEKDDFARTGRPDIYWEMLDTRTGKQVTFEAHIPSAMFLASYLPFFDQYALSQSMWAPDSSRFCYAGRGAGGEDGAWVQDVPKPGAPPAAPRLVVPGAQSASWSPC